MPATKARRGVPRGAGSPAEGLEPAGSRRQNRHRPPQHRRPRRDRPVTTPTLDLALALSRELGESVQSLFGGGCADGIG